MNTRQKKILGSWRQLLWDFARREWLSLFVSSSLGVLAAESAHLFLLDHSFQSFLASEYKSSISFDEPRYYAPYLTIVFITMFLAVGPFISGYIWRGLKSWWTGVTSGLLLLSFASVVLFSLLPSSRFHHRLILGCGAVGAWFFFSFVLYLVAKIHAERTVREDEFKVPSNVKALAGSQLSESDDPIQSWEQDTLGRAALVDSLSVKIMIAKAPVLALDGVFGSGKTSTLNLLREHLGDKTITVSFSTWLPGSQETLTSYLLADIANQCKKQYVVPGLRQSTRRLATALGQKVPLLGDYLKLLPVPTQKDAIENLKSALVRLPKRVVVLLDEIDRMEKEEIVTLLKVIRGISTLPNLSFVCAGDRQTLVETVKGEYNEKSITYFDKFFPVLIQIPEPDSAALRRAGTERLVAAFISRDWFEDESDKEKFREQIEKLWEGRIAPFCRNLRTIGLLANDVSVAAAPLRREVDPVDLTLIELLRRFQPVVYEIVARNSLALTGGESIVRGGPFQTDRDAEENKSKFLAGLKSALPNEEEVEQVKGILIELFPLLSEASGHPRRARPLRKDSTQESDKRISEPGMFPAYFRYEIPDVIFSSVEMASFLQRFELAASQTAREKVFLDTFQSMEKGSLKRDDFLRKLADSVKSIPVSVAKSLGENAVKASGKYTYDMIASFGEAGHVLRMILLIAQRLSQTERAAFLQECILNASDDTMAFRILTILTQQKDDSNINVSVADLYASFAMRMRKRYGRDVDAANFDLSTSDPWALDYWGRDFSASGIKTNPEDRKIQNDFWLRYIGNSRSRLAKAFREMFLPVAAYSEDPAPLVQNRISLEDLRRLYEELPDDPSLTNADLKSLGILDRFLKGEFKNGISPTSGIW
jgi:predicted KAP-like P-loop ATPase